MEKKLQFKGIVPFFASKTKINHVLWNHFANVFHKKRKKNHFFRLLAYYEYSHSENEKMSSKR